MNKILLLSLFISTSAWSSVVGISTHPMNRNAKILSAEMTGYMSQRHEMGMGMRYTQEINRGQLLDIAASGAQESRGANIGGGLDFELLREDISQPRVSLKTYYQHMKFEDEKLNLMGIAPTMRKGLSIASNEIFPYIAIPTGLKINSATDHFDYYASLTMGASMPLSAAGGDKLLLSLEGNKDLGASSDYVGMLISWVWK